MEVCHHYKGEKENYRERVNNEQGVVVDNKLLAISICCNYNYSVYDG
nr:hypothetical protein [uncultured Acetobacteroides sp.]